MVLPGGSKVEKDETNDMQTLIIHDTAICLHFRLDQNLPTSPVLSLSKFRSSAEEEISPIGTYTLPAVLRVLPCSWHKNRSYSSA